MNVRISETAKRELDLAAEYYRNIHTSLALRLILEFEAIVGFIADFPEMYRRATNNVRIASLASFPFEIYYRIELNEAQILQFLPARIDPQAKEKCIDSSQQ